MLFSAMLQWWYTDGWKTFFERFIEKMRATMDHFSIGLLLKTLFAPFRQIDSGHLVNASISERFQSFIARTISRFIGAIIRSFVIVGGLVSLFFIGVIGILMSAIWPILPITPIICIVLTVTQVVF